jgi:hypothetical protein
LIFPVLFHPYDLCFIQTSFLTSLASTYMLLVQVKCLRQWTGRCKPKSLTRPHSYSRSRLKSKGKIPFLICLTEWTLPNSLHCPCIPDASHAPRPCC